MDGVSRYRGRFCATNRASVRFSSEFPRGARDDTRTEGIYQDENYASHPWTMACRATYWHPRSVAQVLSGRRIAQVLTLLCERCNLCERNSSQCRGTTRHFFWNPLFSRWRGGWWNLWH